MPLRISTELLRYHLRKRAAWYRATKRVGIVDRNPKDDDMRAALLGKIADALPANVQFQDITIAEFKEMELDKEE